MSALTKTAIGHTQAKLAAGEHRSLSGYSMVAAAVASLGGLLFGYDTGVISGAELYLTRSFHLTSFTEELTVSAVLIGAILGAAAAGRLADTLGRRITLIIQAIIFAVGAILTAVSPNLACFVGCRILVGLAIGAASVVAPMYTAEMAPPRLRGRLVFLFQLCLTIGIAVAYWVDLAFSNAGKGWRPMFGVAIIPAGLLGVGMLFLTDTPRWLAGKGRWEEAAQVMARLSTDDPQGELDHIRRGIEEEHGASFRELFTGGLRLALIAGFGLAVLQQLVGINTVIYYAPTIFGYAGFHTANTAILATSVVGVVNVLATIVAILLVDRVGRRPLLLGGVAGIVVSLIALGAIFAISPANAGAILLVAMLLYIISFAIGMGPVFWLMSAEIFPTRVRAAGAGISVMGNWSANLLVSITFLSLIDLAGKALTFWIYGGFGVITFFFCRSLIPETKDKTLEEIEGYWRNGAHWEPQRRAG